MQERKSKPKSSHHTQPRLGELQVEVGPRLVYVAGPYRGATIEAVELNIATARRVGLQLARAGAMPVIPHANTAGFELYAPDLHDEFWLDGTLELMRRCDAVVLCPAWSTSKGTLQEIAEAARLGIPVFKSVEEYIDGWD